MKKDSTRTGATLCSSMRPRSATTLWLKFKLLAFAFMALLSVNQVWGATAPVNTVLWGENFAHFGTKTPSSAGTGTGTTIYDNASITYDQNDTGTKGYNETLAGGTAPELLLKSGKTWTISGIKTGGAKTLSLEYLSNNTKSSVTCSTSGVSVSGSSKSYTIKSSTTGAALPETITLVFGCSGNTRLDNIVLKVTEAGASTYTVNWTINPAAGGTLSATSGTSTTVTPNSAYTYGSPAYTVTSGSATVSQSTNTFTATPSANCTIRINMVEKPKYTVTLKDDNSTLTQASVGASVTLPSRTGCTGYTFAGWTKSWTKEQSSWTTTAPTIISAGSYTPEGNENLYPVYTKEESGSGFSKYEKVTSAPSDWSGQYLLSTGTYTATGAISSSHLTRDTYTSWTTEATSREFTLAKVGDVGYSIKFGSNYLGYSSGTNFSTNTTAPTATSTAYLWTPSTSGINNVGTSARKISDGGSDFRPYSNPSDGIVYLYKRIEGGSTTFYISIPSCGPSTYTVNFVAGSNGTVSSPSIEGLSGEQTITINGNELTIGSTTITANPNSGYKFNNWTNGGSVVTNGQKVSGTCTITANFVDIPKLTTPTGLSVSNITSSGATLSWNAVSNATKYTVTIIDLGDYSHDFTDITTTSTTIDVLSPSTDYMWTVKAIGDGSNYLDSEESDAGEFTTLGASTKTIYLEPNVWDITSAKFFVHAWGGGDADVEMATTVNCESKILQADVPLGTTDVLFTRQNKSTSSLTWDWNNGLWNKSESVSLGDNNYVKITTYDGDEWDGSHRLSGTEAKSYSGPNWSVRGTFNDENYGTAHTMVKGDGCDGTVSLTLAANTTYYFKVVNETLGYWYGCTPDPTPTASFSNYDFVQGENNNCPFTTTVAGIYTFAVDYSNPDAPKVSVTYPIKYTVTYDGNGNTSGSAPAAVDYAKGATVTVAGNTGSLAKTGYDFDGWNTNTSGTGTNYTAGSGTFIINANTPLYAKWTIKNYVVTKGTVTGGSATVPSSVNHGGDVTLTDLTPDANHKLPYTITVTGNYGSIDGATIKNVTSAITVNVSFAEKAQYTVTFKNNGTQTSTESVVEGGTVSSLPTLAASQAPISGYTFIGWVNHTNAWSGFEAEMTQALITGNEVINADVTYHAVWAKVTNNYEVVREAAGLTAGNYVIDGYDDDDETEEAMDNTFAGKTFPTEDHGVISTTDNSIIWNVTIKNGQYALKNLSTNTYFNFTNTYDLTLSSTAVYLTISGEVVDELYEVDLNNSSKHLEYDGGKFDGWNSAYNTIYFYKQKINNYFVTPPAQITVTWHIGNGTQAATTYDGTAFSDVDAPSVADDAIGDCVNKFMGWATAAITKDEATADDVAWADETTISNSNKDFYAVFAQAGGSGPGWTIVTDASSLQAGDQLIIASNEVNKTAGDITGTNVYLSSVGSTFSSDKSAISEVGSGTMIFTLGGTSSAWTLENAGGDKLGATEVKKLSWVSGTNTWTISISDGNATIANTTDANGRFLGNNNSGGERFTTYASTTSPGESSKMYNVQLYRNGGSYSNYVTSCPDLKYATIHFDVNGKTLASGSMPADITNAVVGRANTLPGCSATVTGYTFAGWSATQSGEVITEYTPTDEGQTYTMYAIWTPKTVTITWNANGGSVTPASSSYTYDGASVELPTPTTTAEQKFVGWFTEATGGTQITEIGTTNKPVANVTYFAQWRDIVWTDYLTDCSAPYTWTVWADFDGDENWSDYTITDGVVVVSNVAKESIFDFKIRKTNNNTEYTYYGASGDGNRYTTSDEPWTLDHLNENGYNVHVHAGAAGVYTINVTNMTGDAPQITVTYPTAYTITFDGNGADGGSMTNVTNIAAGEGVTLDANAYTKTGNHFKGWVADVDVKIGGATVTAGTLIADAATIQDINSNITLTAQWETAVTAITISNADDLHELTVGSTLQLDMTLTPASPEYGGPYTWYTSNGATMTVDQNGLVTGVQANTNEYIYVRSASGIESNHYIINVKSSTCDEWGLHYWNDEHSSDGDLCFVPVAGGAADEYRTEGLFSLPSNSDSEWIKVLYNGMPREWSREWHPRWVPMIGLQGAGCGGDNGAQYAGQDAIGYFRINTGYGEENYHLAFQPVYAMTFGVDGQAGWVSVDFAHTNGAEYGTEIVEIPSNFSSLSVYVGTKRADVNPGVNFIGGRSKTVPMNTVPNMTSGEFAGKFGKFYIHDNYCNESNFNLSFIRYYRLHYNLDGGAGTGDYSDQFALPSASAADRTFTLATAPTKDGFTFRGWSVSIGGGEATTKQAGETVELTEDAVVTAIWAQNYTVTYDLDGYSTLCSSSTVHYCGEEVTVCPAPDNKTGYTFMGWNTDDITGSPADYTPEETFEMPCNDVVFTAHYEANEYAITYEGLEGATNTNPANYTIESNITFVNPGTRIGYTFTGWTENGNPITGITAGTTGIKTITANWSLNSHDVTFNANGHGTAPAGYTGISYGATITEPTAPADVEEGGNIYSFIGWYKENTCTNAWNFATDVMPDNDLTLYAKWSGVTYEDYRTHCCTPLDAPTGGEANDVHMITATLSWGEVTGNNGYQVSADQASWVDVLDGTSYDLTGLTAGTHYIYYVRAKGDNDEYCQYGTTAQIEFTTKAALHITYNANGGTGADVVSEVIEEGASATVAGNTFTAPTGMTFNGWNTATDGTGTAYDEGDVINPLNENLTLYAQWIGATFNVTYDLAGGTGDCESTTATYNSTFTICSAIPTKGTNAFTGWSSNVEIGGKSTFQPGETFTMPASNVTLTAQWAASYTVTYVINNVEVSGPNPAGDVYVAQGQPTTLPDFTFSCGLYNQFIGWVDATVAEQDEKIPCPTLVGKAGDSFTPTGDITLYALFGHDAENLGWVKQTTISSGKYLMSDGTRVMTGFHNESTSSNYLTATSASDDGNGQYATKPNDAAELEVNVLGDGKFTMMLLSNNQYLAAASSSGSLNPSATITDACKWELMDGSTQPTTDLNPMPQGSIHSVEYTSQGLLGNTSQVRFTCYDKISGKSVPYLYKLINEGYYTTSPTCEIPTSVTVTYNKNTEGDVTMCGNATLEFTTYPHLTEAYTLCAAANVVREGYVLRTWNTAANGTGKNYTPGTVFTELGNNLNLYAQWDRVYTVTFHDKYGSAEATATEVTQASLGSTIDVPAAALDDDCITFVGWTSESTVQSGNPVQPNIVIAAGTGTYTPEEDMHLYAIYSKEGSALDFAPATEGVRSFYLANTALTAYATGTIGTSTTGNKFSSEATTDNATPIFIDYQTSHVGNFKYTIRTANGYLAPASGGTATNFMSQAEPYYWNIVSGSDGGYNIKVSSPTDRQISISGSNFGFYQSATSVKLVPCAASTFWSNPTCAEFVTITFQTVGDITIDWTDSKGSAEDYKDLPINTSITQWPTAQYEGWTFAGWSKVDYSNSSKYAGSFAEDTKNGTIQPDQSDGLYANENATLELIANNNYNMYPIFTKVEETTQFDEAIGGDYYIYFRGSGTRYKDAYTDLDGEYLRVYATNFDGSKFTSTAVCASAATVTFSKRADGNWNLQTKRENKTVYLTNASGNDFATQAAEPGYGWTMEKQGNDSYQIHYVANSDTRNYIRVFDDGSSAITASTFKCYSQDQEHSSMYMPVYIGSCVERTYSSEPSNKAKLQISGAAYITSTAGQGVRSAMAYKVKGSFLKANTTITLTDNAGVAITYLALVDADGKAIKADANGMLEETTAYVVYNPTETTDGIENREICVSALDRSDVAITNEAKGINNIHLRHLPAKFLIAQKVGDDWYALPNNMSNNQTNPAAVKLLSVNEATGTATIYSDVENIYAYTLLAGKASTANMVFNSQATGKTGSALRSSTTESETTMGLYAMSTWSSTKPEYEFTPATEDLKDYTLTNALQNADLGIADGNWVISGDQTVRFFAIDQKPAVNLTLSGDVVLTSANGIEVYGNQTSNLLHISADYTNVAKLRYTYNDGTSDVAVSNSVFRLNYYSFPDKIDYNYADATTANHTIDVSSLTGEVNQTFSVSLKPTAANTMYNYTLTIAALDANNNVMEEKQITLKGRSLPERFVIAMKSTNGDSWYALPNDLATSTSEGSSTKAPIMISVDNTTTPTKALMAPKNTLYKGYSRYEATKHRNAIRFLRADATSNAWITTCSTSQLFIPNYGADKQQFNLLSSDLSAYTITQDEDTRTIAMYGGTIGWYDSGNNKTVYLLPVDASAEPAVFDIVEWFPTKLLIESSQAITNTSVKVGDAEAVAGTAGTTTYGTNLYEVQTGDLTAKAGQAMSVSYTIEATTYAKVVTVPIILSRGTYATSTDLLGGLSAQSKYQDNDLVVRDGATLTVDAAIGTWNKFVNVTIYPTSKVVVPAQTSDEKDVTMTTTTMTLFGGTDEIYNGSEYTLTKYGVPQLVLNGKLVHNATTSGLVYDVRLDATQYYNFALPYTSKYELVTDNKGGEDFTFWTKIYDGATRAAGNNGWVWYNWNADPWAINIGTGYMFAAQPYGGQNYIIIRHPMGYDATENADGHRTSTAEATKAAVDVYAYPSKYDNNAGWNYIANPFMANFTKDLGDGSTGTIQTGRLVEHKVNEKWDGHYEWEEGSKIVRYVTLYDNGSDTYTQLPMSTAVLAPFTGFFVQMAENGTIVFDISGRTNEAPARMLGEDELPSEMEIFLHATCQGQKDDAVLFINDNLHRDNAKEFPNEMTKQENANTLNFYTFGGDDIKMYANGMSYEDAQGWSKAGVKVATAGEYTFSVASDQADYIQQVILRDMDSNTEYDLMSNDAKIYLDKGEMNDRFYVKIVFGKHNIGTGVTERYDTSGPEKFILNDHMYIRANGVLFDGVGKRVKY
ncbi:MAG: InlB B-repeat-containing protein [Paludibacteraceae bacterium]|nr:InlB B-repeat-containing protein [Paludibacteraceae bacterium]